MIKQVNVFVENRQGRVCDVIEVLAREGINILTLSIADTTDYGVMRLIVDKPYSAQKAIMAAGFIAKVTHVIAVAVDHTPGELAKLLKILRDCGQSVEYLYAFCVEKGNEPIIVIRPTHREPAVKALEANDINLITIEQEEG